MNKKKITRVDFLKLMLQEGSYWWGWLSASEKEYFKKSPKEFTREYFKTWELKELFEEYLAKKKEEQNE